MYEAGQWNAICDRCGKEYKARQLRKEWNGLRTCHGAGTCNCWEPRHPQEFVKGRADRQAPPWTRPEADATFLSPGDVTADDL